MVREAPAAAGVLKTFLSAGVHRSDIISREGFLITILANLLQVAILLDTCVEVTVLCCSMSVGAS
jgi:hypothetical protein